MQLTKDADKLVSSMYKSYLEKRKSGVSKNSAGYFELTELTSYKCCSKWSEGDIFACLCEIKAEGLGEAFQDKSFQVNNHFVAHMENRFKNGLIEVTDFIAKLIP